VFLCVDSGYTGMLGCLTHRIQHKINYIYFEFEQIHVKIDGFSLLEK